MKFLLRTAWLAAAAALCAPALAQAPPKFDPRFSEGMVLQRDTPLTVSGHADPGTDINVSFAGDRASTKADQDGRWNVTLPAQPPGAELILTVASAQGETTLSGLSVGDVFLCSGQSNMEWPVSSALNPATELSGPFPGNLHLLKIPQASKVTPQENLPDGASWKPASRESAESFSALCYFFGRDWQASQNIPVGLIDASWGGSRIEAWIGPDRLRKMPQLNERLDLLALYTEDPAAATLAFGKSWETWWEAKAGSAPWQDGLDAGKPVPGNLRDWKEFGDPDLETHLGMVWYETYAVLTEAQANGPATLSLGGIDEIDSAWVNGHFAGTTFGWGTERHYELPAGTLVAGKNRILVNVHNGWGQGGMVGPEAAMAITTATGERVPIGSGWTYQKVPPELGQAPQTPWMSVSGLSGMHHGMLSPLAGLPMKGALWYQGESNAGEPETYQTLLSLLTEDLRAQFGESLPLLVVQLPEFGPRMFEPGNSGWSSLRDAQRRFTLADGNTGLVVALNAGDEWDIHPPNKQEIARRARAAWNALEAAQAPGRTGYSPLSARAEPPFVRIKLPDTSGAYRLAGHHRPIGFMLCAADGENCAFAEAWLRGSEVEIDNPFPDASIVRYCWGDTPVCNLMTADGLPVTPFELAIE